MKLRTVRADPAGNITLFVLDRADRALWPEIAAKLTKVIPADQVGFITDNSMEMAGGEFCGNATRAYAMLKAQWEHMSGEHELLLNVSGCARPVRAGVNREKGTAWSEMPLPRDMRTVNVRGSECPIVDLGGIVHLIARGAEPGEVFFSEAEKYLREYPEAGAYGVMFLSQDGKEMRPLVKIPSVGSLTWEGSCGSGTLACAAADSLGKSDGEYTCKYVQPAGEVEARIVLQDGRITEAFIGGKIALDEEITVEI